GLLATWSRLRRLRPSLIHLHHTGPSADRYLVPLARAAAVPYLVVSEHGVGTSDPPGKSPPRPELQRADAVTAVSSAAAESLIRDHGVERPRLRVVGNGADPPDEERERP